MSAAPGRCPLCRQPLYGWITVADHGGTDRVLDRCEACGVGLARSSAPVDPGAELDAVEIELADGSRGLRAPNRASLQASLGERGWAGLDRGSGRLLHTPRSLALLAERNGLALDAPRYPPLGENQAWMWQTLLNGLTLHRNFAREVWARRLRAANARGRIAFVVDSIASVLAAPLVALVSVPMELIAVALRRGGVMVARVRRDL